MASIGDKIKEALTGHSHKDTSDAHTPDVKAPRAYASDEKKVVEGSTNLTKLGHEHRDSEIGAGHVQGRHDPEVDAKEATSQAGNYPYWGDLPQDGKGDHSHQLGTTGVDRTHGGDSHSFQKDSSLAGGASAAGTGVMGAASSGTASRASEYEHRALGAQHSTSTTQSTADYTRGVGQTSSTRGTDTTQAPGDSHKGDLAAATGAGAAGMAAATYAGSRHEDNICEGNTTSELASGPSQTGPGSLDPGYVSQTGSTTTKPQQSTNVASSDSPYATHDYNRHGKAEGALEAGAGVAGVAGLGGAGYLAHKRAEEYPRAQEEPASLRDSQQHDTTSRITSSQPQSTTGGGIHNTVIGAGSTEDTHPRSHKTAFDPSLLSSSNTTSTGPQRGAVNPREQQSISKALGGPQSGNDSNRQGLVAAGGVGAGAAAVAAEEKHRHHEHRQHDDKPQHQDHSILGYSHKHDEQRHHEKSAQPSTTAAQPSAQLAAQQAWNKQNQGNTATQHDPTSEARHHTSAAGNYPYEGQDQSTTSATGHGHNTAALGTAAGAGLAGAGATAAYYGQGREHDQNPRSSESQKIADRALGSDGAAHGPSSGREQVGSTGATSAQGSSTYNRSNMSHTGHGASGPSTGSGQGLSKVLHKCHQCGADNDISAYFQKDADFRLGS